jgi:hypothetical protein
MGVVLLMHTAYVYKLRRPKTGPSSYERTPHSSAHRFSRIAAHAQAEAIVADLQRRGKGEFAVFSHFGRNGAPGSVEIRT